MLAVLVIVAVGAAIAGLGLLALGHRSRFDDVDRFHRASQMTSEWARTAVTRPVVAPREAESEGEPVRR